MFIKSILLILSITALVFCQSNSSSSGSFIRFVNTIEGQTFEVQTSITVPTLAFMDASDYVSVSNGSLAVQLSENGTSVFPTPQLIVFHGFYCTVLIVNNNGSIIMVPYNETLAASMGQNFFNATGNQTLPNRDWVRLINADMGTLIQLLPNSNTSTSLFSYIGFLASTAFTEVDPSTDTKFLVTLQFNTSQSATVTPSYNLSSAYTVIAFQSSNGIQAEIYFDRVIPVTAMTNATKSTTGVMTNGTLTSGTHVTSGVLPTNSTSTGVSTSSSSTGIKLTSTTSGFQTTSTTGLPANSADSLSTISKWATIGLIGVLALLY